MMDELRIPPDHLIASFAVPKPYNCTLTEKVVARLREKGARYVDTKYFPWTFCGSTPPPPEARWQVLNHRADPQGDEEAKMIQLMDIVQTDNNVEVYFEQKFAGAPELVMFTMKELDWKSYGVALVACHHDLLEEGGDDARRANLKTFRGLATVLYDFYSPWVGQIAVDQWIKGVDDYAEVSQLPFQWAFFSGRLKAKLPPELLKDLTACHFFQNLSDGGVHFNPKPWLKNDATTKDAAHAEKLRKLVQGVKVSLT